MSPISLPSPSSQRNLRNAFQSLTLAELYGRRHALDSLIEALEVYQKSKQGRQGELLEFTAARKCS